MSPKEEDLADLLERKAEQIEADIAERELKEKEQEANDEIAQINAEKNADAAKKKARREKMKQKAKYVGAAGLGFMGGLFVRRRRESGGSGRRSIGERMHGDAPGAMKALFWWAVLVHFAYIYFQFQDIQNAMFYITIVLYGTVFLLSLIILVRHYGANIETIGVPLGAGFFYVIFPFIVRNIPSVNVFANVSFLAFIEALIVLVPIMPIYIAWKGELPVLKVYIAVMIGLVVLFLVLQVAASTGPGDLARFGGSPQVTHAGEFFDYIVDASRTSWNKFLRNIGLIPDILINRTGINYYTGMVDDNEKEPVGLYIDNVRPADKYTYVGYPVLIWADIRGKSFTGEIRAEPICYIEKKSSGIVDPPSFTFYGLEHYTLSCNFNDLEKGSYYAKVGASFNFETWAYVTYTFVDLNTKRGLEIQGKNVNYELDVDPFPRAVYTNGPAMLGMASQVDQPVGVDIEHNTREPVLGVTLDNDWTEGEITQVDEFIIMVPDDFDLVKCDRGSPDVSRGVEPGYDSYSFRREQLGDPRVSFQSVTCRLHIKDPVEFLAGSQKVQRTFVSRAKYYYTIKKGVRLYVRE